MISFRRARSKRSAAHLCEQCGGAYEIQTINENIGKNRKVFLTFACGMCGVVYPVHLNVTTKVERVDLEAPEEHISNESFENIF